MARSGLRPVWIPALLVAAVTASTGSRLPRQEDGRRIFTTVCATCHTLRPPPDKAPPMSMIARRYVAAASGPDDARTLVADWIREPDADRSLMPADVIVTFGVMPGLGLSEPRIDAVARYVLTLADSAGGMGPGPGPRAGIGRGAMGMGRGRMGMGRGMMGMGRGMMQGRRTMGDTTGAGRGAMRRDTIPG